MLIMLILSMLDLEVVDNATEFLNVFNSQDPQIQYTIEYKNEPKELNFLKVTIKNNLNQSYDFTVYRKPEISNV